MTKKEAIETLVNRFKNDWISRDWCNLTDEDVKMCEALKIAVPMEHPTHKCLTV